MGNTSHNLDPFPYHVELRDHLKSREPDLWRWFASAQAQADYTESLRLELLKSTYRLDPEGHPELSQATDAARNRLGLDIPVTLYQAQNSVQSNAALYFIPGEGHVVFSGPILTLLDPDELLAVIGHELAHHHLWQWGGGELHIVDRLMQAAAADPRGTDSHRQTARRLQLYTEIYADRGALAVTGNPHPVVAGLVKAQTGLRQVSAASYLKQADEIFSKDDVTTEGLSHPEAFIRARALALWEEHGPEAHTQLVRMIEGHATLGGIDLLGQARLEAGTRRLLAHLLQPRWFQTPSVIGHARLFFPDFQPAPSPDPAALELVRSEDPEQRDYLCYVLLDFASADPELDDLPLAAALELARELGIGAHFEKLATKELKLKARDLRKLKEEAAGMLAKAEGAA